MRSIVRFRGFYISGVFAFALFSTQQQVSFAFEPDVTAYIVRSKNERPKTLAKAKKLVTELRRNREVSPAVRHKLIGQLEPRIDNLTNPLQPYFADADFDLMNPKTGDIGWIDKRVIDERYEPTLDVEVFQIIDRTNVIVKVSTSVTVITSSRPVQRGEAIPTAEREVSKFLWFSGADTAQLSNRGQLEIAGVFAFAGNKTYRTKGGSNTVLVLEKVDLAGQEGKFTRQDEMRTWTAKSGHTSEAMFAGYKRGLVTLMNLEGKTQDVRLSDLSNDDRKYIREQIRAERE